jgi:surface protein
MPQFALGGCESFNQDISRWDVSNVKLMNVRVNMRL